MGTQTPDISKAHKIMQITQPHLSTCAAHRGATWLTGSQYGAVSSALVAQNLLVDSRFFTLREPLSFLEGSHVQTALHTLSSVS